MKPITRTQAILLSSAGTLLLLLLMANRGTGKGLEPFVTAVPDELDTFRLVSDLVDDNEACFVCHAVANTSFEDSISQQVYILEIDSSHILQRAAYYRSNHKSFSCLDCHSREFLTYPHPDRALQKVHWNCIDCHGYDEDYAHFQFERIEEEYLESIHHQARPDSFSCWKCHDPHAYHISIRTAENLAAAIAYDNDICLSCHSAAEQSQIHEWLPNQALHFKSARCIECHTQTSDSILVAHQVMPAEMAVRNCRECHSKNSILLETLYKYQSTENRNKYGFINAAIMNEAFVIGANRNYFLNRLSFIISGLVFVGIAIHIIIRIIKRV